MVRTSLLLPLIALLPGCDLFDDIVSEFDGDLETRTYSVQSVEGRAAVEVELSNQKAFQLTATSGQLLAVEEVRDENGDSVLYWEDWYGNESLTSAIYIEGKDTVLNWPIRAEDAQLSSGTWTVEIGVVDSQGYYVDDELDVVLKLKEDSDLQDGLVQARIVYAEGLMSDDVVTAGVQDAVRRWKEVWSPYGLALEVTYEDSSFGADLSFPGESSEHSQVAEGSDGTEITVLVGETIDGSIDYYGVAGGIPGTLSQTGRALVVVSWLANAGGDGQFSNEDVRLFGETLAHEVGHYMGLFHPVEMTFDYWDALSDTQQCASASKCEDQLGENLMFPYPVCSWTECVAQDDLTAGQTGVSHRYTGTL